MTSFTVEPAALPGLAEIVASLPRSLTPTHGGSPQIGALAGSPGWAEGTRTAFAAGALAVVVAAPADESPESLDKDAASRVVLSWDFAANPGVLAAAAESASLRCRAVMAEGTLWIPPGADRGAALLDLITAATRVFGEMTPLRLVHQDSHGIHVAGSLSNGAPLALAVLTTAAVPSSLELRLLTDDGGLSAVVPSPDTSSPAHVRVVGPDGERLLPTLWITSRRASWQRAVAIAAGDAVSEDVTEFLHTSSVVSALH